MVHGEVTGEGGDSGNFILAQNSKNSSLSSGWLMGASWAVFSF